MAISISQVKMLHTVLYQQQPIKLDNNLSYNDNVHDEYYYTELNLLQVLNTSVVDVRDTSLIYMFAVVSKTHHYEIKD